MENISNQKWWVLFAIGIGTFMTALDTSVVNTILPLISRTFNSGVADVEWVVTIYLLLLSGLLLSFGRLGDLRGHKAIYLSGFGVFVVSSMLCGLARSVEGLVVFRALQALGAAMLSANSPAILTKNFPPAQRGRALGLQATMTYLGLMVGPSLGGWLATKWGWPLVFYINVPVGLAAFMLSWRVIPNDAVNNPAEKFDLLGSGLFLAGLSTLLLGLNQGHNWGWGSPPILALLLGAVFLLGWFLWVESRAQSPMLDLSLFKHPVFTLTAASAVLNYIGVYSVIFLMPFYLIRGLGLTPAQAGLILTAQPVIMAIVAPISGTLSDRVGTRLPAILGMMILSIGLLLLSRLDFDSSRSLIMASLGVVGLGTGMFISPNNSALMGSAPRTRQGIAAGILATARNFGMVLGVGLAGAIFTTILALNQPPGTTMPGLAGSAQPGLFQAIQISFLVAAGITFLGVFTSATREKQAMGGEKQVKSN
jgi:EmrB/QacA subfamily drug resistance transporter